MKSFTYIFLTLGLLFLSGCSEDWVEQTNPNVQTTGSFWKTEQDAVKAVNAIYQALHYDGTFLRFAPCALDLRGDDVWSPSPWDVLSNTGSFKLFNNTIMQEWLWVAFYGGVTRANLVVDNIDKITFSSDALKNQLRGEALFLRGLNYFYLVTFFNHIPLVTKSYESADEYFPGQSDPEAVWAQIFSDFDEASKLLPESYVSPDVGRATKGAALGYLGKSYLFNYRYADAAQKFEEVMALGIYGLMDNYNDNFT